MNEDVEKICDAIRHQRCVIFFGSGISANSGLPTGEALVRELLRLPADQSPEDYDLAKWAQILRHRQGDDRKWLNEQLISLLVKRQPEPKPNELHKILALLNCRYYVTTNYDRLFDDVLEKYLGTNDFSRVIFDEDIPGAGPVTYIKLHGDIYYSESIVLTYDDYQTRFDENPNLLHLLFSLFSQNLVLFVGYSLRDPNILSVVRKIGHGKSIHAKGMYIVLDKPNRNEIDFFNSLKVHVIPVSRLEGEEASKALERFLLTLWDHVLDFNFYLEPEPKVHFSSFLINLEIAISAYRRAEYEKAYELFKAFSNLKEKISLWGKNPGAFAQYSYFRLKTLDKLNHWAKVKETRDELLETLDDISSVYPGHVTHYIRTQINASSGFPMMRATLFKDAESYLKSALDEDPDVGVIGKDAVLLYADRHTVLASVNLNLAYFGEQQESASCLEIANEHLEKAGKLFTEFGNMDGPNEVHYLGRYFGVKALLGIAETRLGRKTFEDDLANEILNYGRKAHREIVEGKNRVNYGKLAGKYCEAIANLFSAQQYQESENIKGAMEYYAKCESILEECFRAEQVFEVKLAALERCKIFRAFQLMFADQSKISTNAAQCLERSIEYERQFDHAKTSLLREGMLEKVLQDRNWVYTPIN